MLAKLVRKQDTLIQSILCIYEILHLPLQDLEDICEKVRYYLNAQ